MKPEQILLQQAVAHHQGGRLKDAEWLYRSVLQSQPDQPEANYHLGVLRLQAKQFAASLANFKAAVTANPGKAQYWLSYIDALIQDGQMDAARQVLKEGQQQGLQGPTVDALAGRLTQDEDSSPTDAERKHLVSLFGQGRYAEAEALALTLTGRFPNHGFGWKVLGACLTQQGRPDAAVETMRRAVALLPEDGEAHYNLGVILKDQGRLDEAKISLRRACELKPDDADVLSNLGSILGDLGRLTEAEACYHRLIELRPDVAEAHFDLGVMHRNQGRMAEAEASYRQALTLDPNLIEACFNLGNTVRDLGHAAEAEACYRRALQLRPDLLAAHINLSTLLMEFGRMSEAEAILRLALKINPDLVEAHINLGNALRYLSRNAEAEAVMRRSLALQPDLIAAYINLSALYKDLSRFPEAEASLRRVLALEPDHVVAHINLSAILRDLGRFPEAEASLRRALQFESNPVKVHEALGEIFKDAGRLAEAEASFRRALSLDQDYADVHGKLLFTLNYNIDHDPAACLEDARSFGRMASRKAGPVYSSWQVAAQPQRLRVGLVSGDLRNHPVGYFLEGLLAHIDPQRIELIGYPSQAKEDELTARIKPRFAAWNSLVGQSDAAAAQRIHDDGVHVLIDLAGHTAHNRLPVFAAKPAPVQVSWLGYFATTGVVEMDYLIADPWTLPESEENNFTEQIWRLPETRLCFTAPQAEVAVAGLPALNNGYITFGCFNNLAKMNYAVVALWSQVLHAVPKSRLFLKAQHLAESAVCQGVIERFSAHGISRDRLILEGPSLRAEYLATYQRVDIALDPFPFTGGTTSAEGLWMGVPVLTLAGERFLSRQGVGLLINAGLPDWIAVDAEDYVAKAVAHSADLERLAALRAGLREQVLAAPLFDAPRFAARLENALWEMWLRHSNDSVAAELATSGAAN